MTRHLYALSLIILCFISFSVHAQPTIQWAHAYGGSSYDFASDVKLAVNGGYIFCGTSYSDDDDITGPTYGSLVGGNIWLVRIDTGGNIIWETSYGGGLGANGLMVQNTGDGYIMIGQSFDSGGEVSKAFGSWDIWVIKTDTAGNLLWEQVYGSSWLDVAGSIQKTNDGGYIIAGSAGAGDGDVTHFFGGDQDYWVIKIDKDGNIQWQKTYGGSYDDEATAIQQTNDGGYIVTGSTSSADSEITGNHGSLDVWTLKLDDTGGIQWKKCYGGSGTDAGNDIKQTPDGGYIMACITTSPGGDGSDVTGYHGGDTTDFDIWIVKTDSIGTLQWEQCYGGTQDDEVTNIQLAPNGGYIFTGVTNSLNGDVTGLHGDANDYWVVKIDDTGKILWQKTLGGSGKDGAASIMAVADSSYLVAGVSESNDGDVSGNHGLYDCWLVMLKDSYNDTDTISAVAAVSNNDPIRVYPTLTTGLVHAVVPQSIGAARINLIDMLGQEVPVTEMINGTNHLINISGNRPGMYLLQVTASGVTESYKIVYKQ